MAKGLLIDIAGVLYQGGEALPGAIQALARLQSARVPHLLVTNTTRQTGQQLARQLTELGFYIERGRILSAADATAEYLRDRRLHPYLLVHPGIRGLFADLVDPIVDAVVLGDAGDAFDYNHLNRAFRLIMEGAPLIAMGDSRYFKDRDGALCLDIAPFRAALETAAGVRATIIGKPSARFFLAACHHLALPPAEVMMIGDDAETDVAGAQAAGLQACLVKTGKYRAGDEQLCPNAAVADDLARAVDPFLDGEAVRA